MKIDLKLQKLIHIKKLLKIVGKKGYKTGCKFSKECWKRLKKSLQKIGEQAKNHS